MEEWSDSVRIAIDVLVACIIVTALLVCGRLSGQIMTAVEHEQMASENVREYRIVHMYDGHECYASDIINLIVQYQGEPAVSVKYKDTSDGTIKLETWQKGTNASLFAANKAGTMIPNKAYMCTVTYDANGSVSTYAFEEVGI